MCTEEHYSESYFSDLISDIAYIRVMSYANAPKTIRISEFSSHVYVPSLQNQKMSQGYLLSAFEGCLRYCMAT